MLDPFCGCGTTIDAAQRLGRRWIGIDITYIAVYVIRKRLLKKFKPGIEKTYVTGGIPTDVEAARALCEKSKFEFARYRPLLQGSGVGRSAVNDRGR